MQRFGRVPTRSAENGLGRCVQSAFLGSSRSHAFDLLFHEHVFPLDYGPHVIGFVVKNEDAPAGSHRSLVDAVTQIPQPQQFRASPEDLPEGDYVSPGLDIVIPDRCFPGMRRGDKTANSWRYLRREIPHLWYCDESNPLMGFINRDEATLLYNIAKGFGGLRALEIGCWFGWSTCHLALGGVSLDVIDPALADGGHRAKIEASLRCCGVFDYVRLHPLRSPEGIAAIAPIDGKGWDLFFIDGDHELPGPELDVEICLKYAASNVAFVFHDLASPEVAAGLRMLEARGFNVLVYQTMQIMGVAWRGNVQPVRHTPDPTIFWQLPHHLVGLPVSGVDLPGFPANLRMKLAAQDQELASKDATIKAQAAELREVRRWNPKVIARGLWRRLPF